MSKENIENIIKMKAEEKIKLLLNEGRYVYCDEDSVDPKKLNSLPEWYDNEKFKRGQKFFHEYIFIMLFAKVCGLMTLLLMPTILEILKMTNMSSSPLAAYRRYMATIFHMTLWYDKDFNPQSKSWQSIKTVRNMHFSASKRAFKYKLNRISQTDMVITQFGFIGYVITHPKKVGFYKVKDEELEDIIHLWRVVGYMLGIEDRFNLCSESVEETRENCKLLIQQVFSPRLKEADDNFKQMAMALIDGMRVFQPCLNYATFITYIHELCDVPFTENNNSVALYSMTWSDKMFLHFTRFVIYTYQFLIFRLFHNVLQTFALYYIIRHLPFFAYIKFGIKNGKLPKSINNIIE